jgi:Fe-Mn family superoxide dismutase
MTRREAIVATTLLAGSSLLASTQDSGVIKNKGSKNYDIKPLPKSALTLKGISAKVIESHHKNNYSGAVKKLNLLENKIKNFPKEAHPVEFGAYKKEQLIALNSKILHELYFENLSANSSVNKSMKQELAYSFGSYEFFEAEFVKTAKSLSGGSGWVVLLYSKTTDTMVVQIASDHSDSVVFGVPLLVLDMYEHSYHMDYGANAGAYIEAFMKNINWDVVQQRFENA